MCNPVPTYVSTYVSPFCICLNDNYDILHASERRVRNLSGTVIIFPTFKRCLLVLLDFELAAWI